MAIQSTLDALHALRLHGMRQALEQQLVQTTTYAELPFDQRLGNLVDAETTFRDNRRLNRILKVARLKDKAMPEDLIYRGDRNLDRNLVSDLLTCQWVAHHKNLILTGPTGTGKTWIACALGMQAARMGYPVLYHRISLLLEAFGIAHADGSITRLRAQLGKAELLILDDFGLAPFTPRGKSDLLNLLDDRIGSGSTVIAGQLPMKGWHDFIDDPAVADAILDRLIHSAHKIQLKGESMRKQQVKDAGETA